MKFIATIVLSLSLKSLSFSFLSTSCRLNPLIHNKLFIQKQAEIQSAPINETIGIIICDHGSRRDAANEMLHEVASRFQSTFKGESSKSEMLLTPCTIEIAHMELAEPSIEQAFDKCVAAGATLIVCHPFFLSPGRHVNSDIPNLLDQALMKHQHLGIKWIMSDPLGLAPLMPQLMNNAVRGAIYRHYKQV